MKRPKRRTRRDPVVSLINIVFLILIFFMVAGTLARAPTDAISFVQTSGNDCCVPPDALAITREGALLKDGVPLQRLDAVVAAATHAGEPVRLLPDRGLPARILLSRVSELRAAGAGAIVILTEDTGE